MFTPTRALLGRAARASTRKPLKSSSATYAPSRSNPLVSSRKAPSSARGSQSQPPPPPSSSPTAGSSHSSKWLDDMEVKLKALRTQDLKPKVSARLGKRLKRIADHRLELLAGREGFLSDARARGVDQQTVAWGEMDPMVSHVNNVHFNRWAESGRVNWIADFEKTAEAQYKPEWKSLLTPQSLGVILKSIKTEYKFPITHPDKISVIHKIANKVTPTSDRFFLEGIIFSERHGRITARTTEEIVVYDYQAGEKAPLKPFMAKALSHMYELQERRRAGVENEIEEMRNEVEEVEEWIRARGGER